MLFRFVLPFFILLSSVVTAEEIPPTTTFYIVRHGQTDWNLERKMQGQTDIPLNATGKKEAIELALKLQDIPFIAYVSSDLHRAFETAFIIAAHNPSSAFIFLEPGLRERSFGHWEGSSYSEFHAAGPEEKLDVETVEQLQQRAFEALQVTVQCFDGGNILIVTHGGVMRGLLLKMLDLNCSIDEIETKNTAFMKVTHCDGHWSVNELNGIQLPVEQLK